MKKILAVITGTALIMIALPLTFNHVSPWVTWTIIGTIIITAGLITNSNFKTKKQ